MKFPFLPYFVRLKNTINTFSLNMSQRNYSIVFFIFGFFMSFILFNYRSYFIKNENNHKEIGVFQMYTPQMNDYFHDVSPFYILSKNKDKTNNVNEAMTTVKAAKEMLESGKMDKAQKLFEHAIALAPNHPDILTYYGEFLECTKEDIVEADHHYVKVWICEYILCHFKPNCTIAMEYVYIPQKPFGYTGGDLLEPWHSGEKHPKLEKIPITTTITSALMRSPDHSAALLNLKRVSSLVSEIDNSVLKRLDKKRDNVIRIPETNAALMKAKREAYFQHIYHTVGIEGNTMTLSQTRSIVETRMAVGGKSVAEHNEILGLDAALKYINKTLINRIGRLTIDNILEIHRRVLGFVDPTEGGTFRTTQVFVGDHVPPSPSNIPPLMNEFEEWLNSWESMSLHPVRYASLAHYKLVHIHPFHDGNGRTSRLLMNMILMNAGYPPVIILKQDRHRYYQMLELANEGDIRPFMRFIAECTERTLDLFLWSTSEYASEVSVIEPTYKAIGSNELN